MSAPFPRLPAFPDLHAFHLQCLPPEVSWLALEASQLLNRLGSIVAPISGVLQRHRLEVKAPAGCLWP